MADSFPYETESLCPVCLEKIGAHYITKEDKVYLSKSCAHHGNFETLVWEGAGHFNEWRRPLANVAMEENAITKTRWGCPYDCGICPDHRQRTCCVLLEVTKRCGLNCPVCYASAGNPDKDPKLEEVESWYDMLIKSGGPYNIQLSGGEPTIRDDLAEIIAMGVQKGFDFFQLNTNGIRIGEEPSYLEGLFEAGLRTVFLQFDGFGENTYKTLRGRPLLEKKIAAIENCKRLNLGVVLVPTLKKGVNDGEIGEIIRFAVTNMPHVRGVHFQPMSFFGRYGKMPANEDRLTIPGILKEIEMQTGAMFKAADFSPSGAEHAHCSFHGDFVIDGKNTAKKLARAENSCCSSAQARTVVARKWSMAKESCCCQEPGGINTKSFDDFLDMRRNRTISISGMAFQDAWNIDLERLKRCYINIVSGDGRLVPFCAYNLTAMDGRGLYRTGGEQ